jgi:hypothetical protein
VMGWPRRGTRLATPEECQEVFGYVPGCMPPVGYPPAVAVLADRSLLGPLLEGTGQSAAHAPAAQQQLSGGGKGRGHEEARGLPRPGSAGPRFLFCGSGAPGVCLRLHTAQLRQLVPDAAVTDISVHPPAGASSAAPPGPAVGSGPSAGAPVHSGSTPAPPTQEGPPA